MCSSVTLFAMHMNIWTNVVWPYAMQSNAKAESYFLTDNLKNGFTNANVKKKLFVHN